jgi:aminoglycoside phosphotransferase (APT) family kinase protein
VHGDYSPKNVLVYQARLILLDHEVIHWGDPAFDLGFSLTHLLSKAHHVVGHRLDFAQACIDYWQSYLSALHDVNWLDGLEARAVRHTLGCLLARVAGRSPLEYLSSQERNWQQAVVVELMKAPPTTIDTLVNLFLTNALP